MAAQLTGPEIESVLSELTHLSDDERRVLRLAMMLPTVSAHVERSISMGGYYESFKVGVFMNTPLGLSPADLDIFENIWGKTWAEADRRASIQIMEKIERVKGRVPKKDSE